MTQTLSLVYFPAALLLGALHALEPGHAKALTASYLIGIKGTKKDSILLGLSVAATHSIVVILIASIGMWLGNEAFAGEATKWLERGSGLIAIAIGSWMLYRRLFIKRKPTEHHHEHEPVIVPIQGSYLNGEIAIIPTSAGERMKFSSANKLSSNELIVEIGRSSHIETIKLTRIDGETNEYLSDVAPQEPHEFKANLILKGSDSVTFEVHEPEHHHADEHDHAHMDDEAHARAHAETLPSYINSGEKPSAWQIITFGAAGGMIPCPASITVMLLALSTGKTAMGLFTVMGFSIGLALALVAVGLAIVTGLSKLSETGKLSWVTTKAPVISAALVIVSGLIALGVAH